jgi:hypothetical protein
MTRATSERRRAPRSHAPTEQALGEFEMHVGAHVVPTGDGHWTYTGRLPLSEVRRFVAQTFDDELPEMVELTRACDQPRCVRPPHMAVAGGLNDDGDDL